MFNIKEFSIFVFRDHIDFRKSINGLSSIVKYEMNLDPFKKNLFLFRNKKRDKIKVLYWDRTGFALWYKVLEKEKFPWPKDHEDNTIAISIDQLSFLLSGFDYWNVKPHEEVFYKDVC